VVAFPESAVSIRILLADDHAIVRDGLRALLERQPEMIVVAEAADGTQAVELATRESPDVAVLDVAMPGLNGIEAARRIVAARPRTAVLMLSMHMDESYVLRSFRAGAKGYLLKDGPREDILCAVRAAAQGRPFVAGRIADLLQEEYVRELESRGLDDSYELLTARERELFQLVIEGKSNKDAATALHVSTTTVETHRAHILRKLSLHSTADLILYAVRKRLITPAP